MKRLLQLSLVLFIVTGLTTIANAQVNSSSIQATANVKASLTVNGSSPLAFGDIISGNSKTIGTDEGSAGRFSITGPAGSTISTSLSTPSQLTGAGNLPVSFNVETGDNETSTTLTPYTDGSQTLPTDGDMWIFIGGTADATGNPPTGSYNGTITLTATYQ